MVKLLLEKDSFEPNLTDSKGRTPLWLAAESSREAVVKLFLTKGVDAELEGADSRTPLLQVKQERHEGVVRLLQSSFQALIKFLAGFRYNPNNPWRDCRSFLRMRLYRLIAPHSSSRQRYG